MEFAVVFLCCVSAKDQCYLIGKIFIKMSVIHSC